MNRDLLSAERSLGLGGHHSAAAVSTEWYTPPSVFEALGLSFDLDPCSPPGGLPWVPAERSFSREQDGLAQPWAGRVWLNPPYGAATATWLRRMAHHGDGVALVFARTDTAWFHEIAATCASITLVAGRLTFIGPSSPDRTKTNGNSGAPSMLMAWGAECATACARSGLGLTFAVGEPSTAGILASLWDPAA